MKFRVSVFLLAMAVSLLANADGYPFREGRFPEGKTSVFRLTSKQKKLIEIYRKCRDNSKTPFFFQLTKAQRTVLAREAGMSPKRFAVFESFRGDDGVDIEFDIINRFDEDHFEVPHKLLLHDDELRKWESRIIGWAPNPIATVNPFRVKAGECPN